MWTSQLRLRKAAWAKRASVSAAVVSRPEDKRRKRSPPESFGAQPPQGGAEAEPLSTVPPSTAPPSARVQTTTRGPWASQKWQTHTAAFITQTSHRDKCHNCQTISNCGGFKILQSHYCHPTSQICYAHFVVEFTFKRIYHRTIL